MTERVLFNSFRTGMRILWWPNLNSKLSFLVMIFCFTLTNQNNGKLHEEPTNRLCCAKNELTMGLVYTEKMTDTQMSWLHILVKDCGSTFIVILKTFLQGKLFCFPFLYGEAVPGKEWKVLFVVVNTTVLTC